MGVLVTMEKVYSVLDYDKRFRFAGTTDDIIVLTNDMTDIKRNIIFAEDVPIIRTPATHKKIPFSDVKPLIDETYAIVVDILLKINAERSTPCMIMAGGCISDALMGNTPVSDNTWTFKPDCDLFFYGDISASDATNLLMKFVGLLSVDITAFYVTKSQNAVTINIDNGSHYDIQFVLRIYNSISEILHGFDLGASSFAYDGDNIYATGMSNFCYQSSSNIVDLSKCSSTFEYRLGKYMKKGFSIICPDLNMQLIKDKNFKYPIHEATRINPKDKFKYIHYLSTLSNVPQLSHTSDYAVDGISDTFNISYSNIYNLIHNITILGKNKIFAIQHISSHHSEQFASFIKHSPVTISDYCFEVIRRLLLEDLNKHNFDRFTKYLTKKDMIEIFSLHLHAYSSDTEEQEFNSLNESVNRIIDKLFDKIKHLRDEHVNTLDGLNWLTENPHTQFTSSLNPITIDPQEWYGDFYNRSQ